MSDCMDIEARRDLAKLYTAHEKLATVVWGPTGENGINSKVKELTTTHQELSDHVDDLEKWATNLWHVERPANCIGQKAVDELRAEIHADRVARDREVLEMKKARWGLYGAYGVAIISVLGPPLLKALGLE